MIHSPFTPSRPRIGSRFSRRIFFAILALLLLCMGVFVVYQNARERQYRIDVLNTRLQDYNHQLYESLTNANTIIHPTTTQWYDDYLQAHRMPGLRLTIINSDGTVKYDNIQTDVTAMSSHRNRKEFVDALAHGSGFDISRNSETLDKDYFYSATYFPHNTVVIRTALPYDVQLMAQLRPNHVYIAVALLLLIAIITLLWHFCKRLDRHINNLKNFANTAERGGQLSTEELMPFPDDELGEVAERIILLYNKLKDTRHEQDRLKKELTQNIAHELKTPVASIQGYLDTIVTQPDMDKKTKKAFISQCLSQATRLSALLADISTLNRLDEGAALQQQHATAINVSDTIQRIINETRPNLNKQLMAWNTTLPPQPMTVYGTESLVYSIFRNLTDNAIFYAGKGTTITIDAQATDNHWHITFADNGVGVPQQHLSRLFERFYRVDKGRSREMGGTGLGLSIVKNSVSTLGGTITVTSPTTGGLQFDIILPMHKGGIVDAK